MNANLFRLVFSKILGMYVPVAEIATVGHKKSGRRARRALVKVSMKSLSCAMLAAFGSSSIAYAQITPVSGSAAPSVTSATNGAAVIDIAAPNPDGLSHNKYQKFDMTGPGAVLNNSLTDGKSSIAGMVTKNPNLNGQMANTILNEVNSVDPSRLRGTLEVFGNRAAVIVANPNGLSVDGLTTLNTSSLILSTGRPTVFGGNVALDVNSGKITIGSGGVNTSGLQSFDVVAKLIELNGQVSSSDDKLADIKAIAGEGVFQSGDRGFTASSRSGPGGKHHGYAITGDSFGAMHGQAISLVATDTGMGVKHPGRFIAPQDISISADGNIDINALEARNLSAKSLSSSVNVANVTASSKISLDAYDGIAAGMLMAGNGADLTARNGGVLFGTDAALGGTAAVIKGTLSLDAQSGSVVLNRSVETDQLKLHSKNLALTNSLVLVSGAGERSNSGLGAGSDAIDIRVLDRIAMTGQFFAVDSSEKRLPDSIVIKKQGAPVVVRASDGATIEGAMISSSVGVRARKGDVSIQAGSLMNDSAIVSAQTGAARIKLGNALENAGLIQGATLVGVEAQNVHSSFVIESAGKLDVLARTGLTNSGSLTAVAKEGAAVQSISLRSGESINNSGVINSNGQIDITGVERDGISTRPVVTNEGAVDGKGVSVVAASVDSSGSMVARKDILDLDLTGAFRSVGSLSAYGANEKGLGVRVKAANAEIGGSLWANTDVSLDVAGEMLSLDSADVKARNLSIKAGSVSANGKYGISRVLSIESLGDFVNRGDMKAGTVRLDVDGNAKLATKGATLWGSSGLMAKATGAMSNEGTVRGRNVTLAAADISNDKSAKLLATQTLKLDSEGKVVNAGMVKAASIDVKAASAENSGTTDARQLNYKLRDGLDNSGKVVSNVLTVSGQYATNAAGASLDGTSSVSFNLGGALTNQGVLAAGVLAVDAGSMTNGATITADEGTLKVAGAVLNDGDIAVKTKISITADSFSNGLDKNLMARTIGVTTTGLTSNAGQISGDMLTVAAGSFNNQSGASIDVAKDFSLDTQAYLNGGDINVGQDAKLIEMSADGLVINGDSKAPVSMGTLTIEANSIRLEHPVTNPGSVVLRSVAGNIDNYSQVATLGDLTVAASENLFNHEGALFWAQGDATFSGKNVNNDRDAWIISQSGDMAIKADVQLVNRMGRIEAFAKNLSIDAADIRNLSELSGSFSLSKTPSEKVTIAQNLGAWHDGRWVKAQISNFDVYKPESNLRVKQGVIRAGEDLNLNQKERHGKGNTILNQGVIYADRILRSNAAVNNQSLSRQLDVLDYLKMPLPGQALSTWVQDQAAIAHGDSRSFGSLYDLLDFVWGGNDQWVSLWAAYGYNRNIDLGNVFKAAEFSKAPEFAKLIGYVLGADWRAVDGNTVSARWKQFRDGGKSRMIDFYPVEQTVMAGRRDLVSTGGAVTMGGNSTRDASQAKLDAKLHREAHVGKVKVETIDGTLDAVFGKRTEHSFNDTTFGTDVDLNFVLPELEELLANKFMFGRAPTQEVLRSSKAGGWVLPQPYFETQLQLVDQKSFYGSEYFFDRVGYQPTDRIYVAGDNFFDTQLILSERRSALGAAEGKVEGATGATLVRKLMDQAGEEMARLGFVVGASLSTEQQAMLSQDIVWYEWARIDGALVLMPRVYLAQNSKEAAEKLRLAGGAAMVSSGTIDVDTEGASIDAHNAVFAGGNVRLLAGGGDVSLTSTGGVQGGITADNEVSVQGRNIDVVAGRIEGKTLDFDATDKFTATVGMAFDANGNLVKRADASQIHGSEGLKIKAKTLQTSGADLSTDGLMDLDADTIDLGAVQEVGSGYVFEVKSGMGEALSFLSQSLTQGEMAFSSQSGSNLGAKQLKIRTKGDVTMTGGSVQAETSDVLIGGSMKLIAAESHEYIHVKEDKRSLSMGASAGAGGYQASARLDSEDSGSAEAGRGTKAGASADVGFSVSSNEQTEIRKTYSNATFNVGTGRVKVLGTADVGGADINSHLYDQDPDDAKSQGKLIFKAGDIVTTKYEDTEDIQSKSWSVRLGADIDATSSIANTATRFGDMISQTVEDPKRKVDPLLTAAMAATEAVQLAMTDTGAVNGSFSIGSSWGHSTTKSKKENKQKVGGNIALIAEKGGIDLTGVDFGGGDTVSLKAKKEVKLRAAKSESTTTAEDHSLTATMGIGAGANAIQAQAGVTVSASISGQHMKTNESSKTYQNSRVVTNNFSVSSGGDFTLEGASVKAKESVDVDVGGKMRVISLQDDIKKVQNGGGWSAGVSASLNTKTIGAITPTFGATYEHHHDNKLQVAEQAGIQSGGALNIKTKGDLEMAGGTLAGKSGSVAVGGKIKVTELYDKIDKDGGKGGVSLGAAKSGPASVTASYARDARDHVETTNLSTIDIGGNPGAVVAQGGIDGALNTDGSKTKITTLEEYYAGGGSEVSAPVKMVTKVVKGAAKSVTTAVTRVGKPGKAAVAPVAEVAPTPSRTVRTTTSREVDPTPAIAELSKPAPKTSETVKVPGGVMKVAGTEGTKTQIITRPKGGGDVVDGGPGRTGGTGSQGSKGTSPTVDTTFAPGKKGTPPKTIEVVDNSGKKTPPKKVEGGKKPGKPMETTARYDVQKTMLEVRKVAGEINQIKDKPGTGGMLPKPYKIKLDTPDGPKVIEISKRSQLLGLDGMEISGKPAQGNKQTMVLRVKDQTGRGDYSVEYGPSGSTVTAGKPGSTQGSQSAAQKVQQQPPKKTITIPGTPDVPGQVNVTWTKGTPPRPDSKGTSGADTVDGKPSTGGGQTITVIPGKKPTPPRDVRLPDGTITKPVDVVDGPAKPAQPIAPITVTNVQTQRIPGTEGSPAVPGTPAVAATPATIEHVTTTVVGPDREVTGLKFGGPIVDIAGDQRQSKGEAPERPGQIDTGALFNKPKN